MGRSRLVRDRQHTLGTRNGYTATYNTQAAGDLIAAIRGVGDYCHWDDNCRVYKSIPGMILKMMAEEGWSPDLKRRENGSSFA
jgi:hypothetical protein